MNIEVDGRYLYGAPASDLGLEGEVNVSAGGTAPDGYGDYQFGLADETFAPLRNPLENLPQTDEYGKATVLAELPVLSQTTKPLKADVVIRMREPSGRVLTETTRLDVRPSKPFIGIKPEFEGSYAGDASSTAFQLVVLDRDGKPTAMKDVNWELSRLEIPVPVVSIATAAGTMKPSPTRARSRTGRLMSSLARRRASKCRPAMDASAWK